MKKGTEAPFAARQKRYAFLAFFFIILAPPFALPTTFSSTSTIPLFNMPKRAAAARVTSMMRSACLGPRSLMRTVTLFLFFTLVTLTSVPNGSVLLAAVNKPALKR